MADIRRHTQGVSTRTDAIKSVEPPLLLQASQAPNELRRKRPPTNAYARSRGVRDIQMSVPFHGHIGTQQREHGAGESQFPERLKRQHLGSAVRFANEAVGLLQDRQKLTFQQRGPREMPENHLEGGTRGASPQQQAGQGLPEAPDTLLLDGPAAVAQL